MSREQRQAEPEEQRKDARFEHDSELVIRGPDADAAIPGRMQNFSSRGFYFESDMFIPPGKTVLIGIYDSPYADAPMSFECHRVKIQWRRSLSNAAHRYGYGVERLDPPAEETGEPTIDELPVLLDDRPVEDRRKNERKAFLSSVSFICDRKYYAGVTKDISSGGLFIRIDKPLKVGQTLNLAIPNTSCEKGHMLRARIVHLESHGIGVKIVGILKPKNRQRTLDEAKKCG